MDQVAPTRTIAAGEGRFHEKAWRDGSLAAALQSGALASLDEATAAATCEASSWEDVQFVLRSKDFDPLGPANGYGRANAHEFLDGTLVKLHAAEHFERRRFESVLFRSDTLIHYERDLLEPAFERIIDGLRASGIQGEAYVHADLKQLAVPLLIGVLTRLVGLDGLDDPAAIDEFRIHFLRLDDGVRAAQWASQEIEDRLRLAAESKRWIAENYFRPSWARRETLVAQVEHGESDADELPNDLITAMIAHRSTFSGWDDGVFEREALLYMLGAIGTTIHNTSLAFAAVNEWLAAHPEDESRLTEPSFITRCVHESLRVNSHPSLLRVALRDATLPSGQGVREGQVVWLNLRSATAERYGEAAVRFDPHQELPAKLHPYGFSFSDGRHTCIGKRFVVSEDPADVEDRRGAAATILLKLFEAGARMQPHADLAVDGSIGLRKRVAQCPIVIPVK